MANLSSLFGNKAFNPADVEEVSSDFSPLPKGQYLINITESEIVPNSKGTGSNLTLKLVVQDGKHRNRIVFDNLCVQHSNATAQAIAQTRLKQICEAVGLKKLTDTSQFHDKDLLVNVDVEFDEYQTNKHNNGEKYYRNSIKGYAPAKAAVTADGDVESEDIPF